MSESGGSTAVSIDDDRCYVCAKPAIGKLPSCACKKCGRQVCRDHRNKNGWFTQHYSCFPFCRPLSASRSASRTATPATPTQRAARRRDGSTGDSTGSTCTVSIDPEDVSVDDDYDTKLCPMPAAHVRHGTGSTGPSTGDDADDTRNCPLPRAPHPAAAAARLPGRSPDVADTQLCPVPKRKARGSASTATRSTATSRMTSSTWASVEFDDAVTVDDTLSEVDDPRVDGPMPRLTASNTARAQRTDAQSEVREWQQGVGSSQQANAPAQRPPAHPAKPKRKFDFGPK
jgi:hypothetical protein